MSRIKGTCATCGLPGHRYGSTDKKHKPNAVACVNVLRAELDAIEEDAWRDRAHWWNQGAKLQRRRTEEALRVLFHVISTNKAFGNHHPNELTDDAIRIGHEFLIEQGWWPPSDIDTPAATQPAPDLDDSGSNRHPEKGAR